MADAVPYKIYTTTINGMPSAQVLASPNTPYSYQESDYNGLGQTALSLLDYYKGKVDQYQPAGGFNYDNALKTYTGAGGETLHNQLRSGQYDSATLAKLFNIDPNILAGLAPGGTPVSSGYVMNNGQFTTQQAIDQDAYWKDQVAKGLAREVQVGNGVGYVPTGSAADLQLQGKSYEEQLKTPSVQKQIQDQNLTPVNPNAPAPAAPAATAPVITPAQALSTAISQVYASRPDLQVLYNPDGSAKNLKDPRVAGIPTLTDWAKKFGVNESPLIKQALNTPASPAGSGAASQGTGSPAGSGTSPASTGAASTGAGATGGSFEDIYSQVYNKLGLKNVKDQYDDYNKQLLDVKNELSDKIADINEDPWLTEGVRIARINKMNERYAQKIENLTNFITLSNSLYQEGLDQAKFLTTGTYNEIQDREAKAEAKLQAAQKIADTYNVTTPYFNKNGTFYRVSDGKGYSSQEEFFKDAGVTSFQEAKAKGLYTDIDPNVAADQAQILDLAAKYPDAGIKASDSLETALTKLNRSRIYRKDTYIAPVGGLTGAQTKQQKDIITEAQGILNQQASGSSDGYVNPNTYRDYKTKYINAGGSASDFFQALPIERYISAPNQKGDLVQSSTAIKVEQTSSDATRLQELLSKSNQGQNLENLSYPELVEFQSLIKK